MNKGRTLRRGSINQRFLQPVNQKVFRFSFYIGSFFSLSLLLNKRETILGKNSETIDGAFGTTSTMVSNKAPRRGSMNKGFCNPSFKYIFKFSFYIGSFFSLSFFGEQERNNNTRF